MLNINKINSRCLLALPIATLLVISGCATSSSSQPSEDEGIPEGYPERPVELSVVYPAGGGMDVTARALAQSAEEQTDYEFRVVNREGAGGLTGHTYLADEASAEGYELGVVAVDFLVFDKILRDANFSREDFAPLAYIAFEPVVHVVRADSELGDMSYEEILASAEESPGDIRVGLIPDNTFDVFTQTVQEQSGAEFTEVPFDGGQPGVTALLGGQIDMTNAFYSEVEQYIESGDLKAVAISNNETYDALPDAATMDEVGVDIPSNTFGAGRMVVAPDEMSEDLQVHLSELLLEVLQNEETQTQFEEVGAPLNPQDREGAIEIYETAFSELGEAIEK